LVCLMNSEVKELVERIYRIDTRKLRGIAGWVIAAERTYSQQIIAASLKEFEPYAVGLKTRWWPYLDRIIERLEAKQSGRESEAEHVTRKEAEADFARDTFGGRGLSKDARQGRDKP